MQLPLFLDRSSTEGLAIQIVHQLKGAIRSGRVGSGDRLPSTRRLSDQLGLSRNTVVRAYETLAGEGYVETRVASGIFVSDDWMKTVPPGNGSATSLQNHLPQRPISSKSDQSRRSSLSFDFFPGGANLSLFPAKAWRRIARVCLSQAPLSIVQQPDPGGIFQLRVGIASHLAATRGVDVDPGQIVVTTGSQEGFSIAVRLLLQPGSHAVIEDPCSSIINQAFEAAGARIIRMPLDDEGMITSDMPKVDASAVYVTPDHQFPTGALMPSRRRQELIHWASRSGAYIIEDWRGGDFHYDAVTVPSFAATASEITLTLGDFSDVLGAGLRIGYLLVPRHLVEAARKAKQEITGGSGWLDQAILAEFIRGGSLGTHVIRSRLFFKENRDTLLSSLRRHFGAVVTSGEASGLHVAWQLPSGVPEAKTFELLARRSRVGIYSAFSAGAFHSSITSSSKRTIFLGYSTLSPKAIEKGIARLSQMVDDTLDAHPNFLNELLLHGPIPNFPSSRLAPKLRRKSALHAPVYSIAKQDSQGNGEYGSMGFLQAIYRYPIKGMSAQRVNGVVLEADKPFPFDRVFAFARPGVPIDEDHPAWSKKGLFVMLMLEEQLAQVQTTLDVNTLQLDVVKGSQRVLSANLDGSEGRKNLEDYVGRLLPKFPSPPKLVRSADGHFMDKPDNVLSLINLATLRDLETRWEQKLDPLRFRANFYVDGLPPWAEFDWVGSDIRIGDAVFRVDRRNGRCSATNVNPVTGNRDLDIPGSLRSAFGHKDLGIYLLTIKRGKVVMGDEVAVPNYPGQREGMLPGAARANVGQYICRGCYYVYDGDATESRTPFQQLPSSWHCPDCGTDKETFRPLAIAQV